MKGIKSIDLLKSGNFSLFYHDNGYCTLHPGKIDYDESDSTFTVKEYSEQTLGYAPDIVVELVKALGGKVDSV